MAEYDLKSTGRKADLSCDKKDQFLQVNTPEQMYFLGRLESLMAIKSSDKDDSSQEKWLENAVGRAIYSTLRDCIEMGVGEEAKMLVRRQQCNN